MLKQELNFLLAALLFYTRLPSPSHFEYREEYVARSTKYLPVVGWLVGGIGVLVLWTGSLFLPLSVSVLLSIVATVWATGAFHEDGFADTCDAFGGGWNKDQVLRIMKDSRVGAYGMIGMSLLLGIKFFTLYEIGLVSLPILVVVYLNGHVFSRFLALVLLQNYEYVQDLNKSKTKSVTQANRLSLTEFLYSSLFVVIGSVFFLPQYWFLISFLFAYLSQTYLGFYFKKRIGGYTGDCLGATQQVCEVVFYLSTLAFLRIG